MTTVLAIVGLIVVVRQAYRHYYTVQQLKVENNCLRRYWKDSIARRSPPAP